MDEPSAEDVVLRPYREDDMAFIAQSWMNSFWDGAIARILEIPPPVYRVYQRQLIDMIFGKSGATSVIAHPAGESDCIIGWVVLEVMDPMRIIHYVYVKEAFRKLGIAKRLVTAIAPHGFTYTHMTARSKRILSKQRNCNFNPWLLGAFKDESQSSRQRSSTRLTT